MDSLQEWFSSLSAGQEANSPTQQKNIMLQNVTRSLGLEYQEGLEMNGPHQLVVYAGVVNL
jgi:hypothetical protein